MPHSYKNCLEEIKGYVAKEKEYSLKFHLITKGSMK